MKTIETSKGEFCISDDTEYEFESLLYFYKGIKLQEITEEQASEIVDEDNDYGVTIYQNYRTTSMQYFDEQLSAKESLNSLLKFYNIEITPNTYIFKT
ncbi:hypothetical protein [Empedobacter brevis]|uniref:hypothetical protein n=1 Tax=Empedobacter brevis TaxID=247 RepID=UPI0028B1165B|nr:hypothetical protein [Empedobacter brevis]